MNAQLVITHGTTDLQIILRDEQGRRWRATPEKSIVRMFHEWLLANGDEAKIVELPHDVQTRDAEATFTDVKDDNFCLLPHDKSLKAQPERSADNRLQLVLPKIGPALDDWMGRHSGSLNGVLVLSTDRGTDEQEPVATYTFLKDWLIGRGVPETGIREEIFLLPGERLERLDSPIAPAIAERIERAVRDFYDGAGRPDLLIGTMGGLPAIKPLLAEIAVLLAGDQAQSLFKTEHGAVGLLPPTPIDALRVRRQCLEQVRRGALLDTFAMAAPYHDDRDARPWVVPLQQAAALINGNPVGARAELPALQSVLGHAATAACLLVAIRVETALLTGHWLEAINGSLTFLEAAFHDGINAWAKTALTKHEPRKRYMLFKTPPPTVLVQSDAIKPWLGKNAGPLAFQANTVGEKALNAWDQVLNNAAIHRLRDTIHLPKILAGARFRLSDYRNYNTHGVMTQQEIDDAMLRFKDAGLWSQGIGNSAGRPGTCFLAQPLVADVIQSLLGPAPDPLALYQALLAELEARLVAP